MTDNYSRVMQGLVVAVSGCAHKCNVHITPKVVATMKFLNFLADDDWTFKGCAKGITPFSIPCLGGPVGLPPPLLLFWWENSKFES